ncbi:putative quinol monooxygenase [Leucothrix arctica]|uniref:Antibiotic biosynthesis monooxygenase n=1 Tax=Leucothrix arctica TaxID=1481894 RepID=A0A317CAI0_9GAMM|nr:putative quinol monooxygenase [Leucothrix arctica]PWQ95141.1 antibiotic biosynthesis monooxygenase [Leucothrix arctica]
MSVNVILEVQSKPESIDELKSTFEKILPDTRSYDGCLSVEVMVNQNNPLNIMLFEVWESREKQEKYFQWRGETGALDALGAILSQPASLQFYDNLSI